MLSGSIYSGSGEEGCLVGQVFRGVNVNPCTIDDQGFLDEYFLVDLSAGSRNGIDFLCRSERKEKTGRKKKGRAGRKVGFDRREGKGYNQGIVFS